MNKFLAQSLNETNILIVTVILVGLGTTIAFSDNIANFFDSSSKMVMDKKDSRTLFKKDNNQVPKLSDVTIKVNNKDLQVPIEEIIRKKLREGKYIQTLGDSGNLNETIAVLNEYTRQIKEIVEDSPENYDFVTQALMSYTETLDRYVSNDAEVVKNGNDPLIKLLNELDIAVDLSQNGDKAQLVEDAAQMIQTKYGHTKTGQLLTIYMNDMLEMGKRITYEIDSRASKDLEEYIGEIEDKKEESYYDDSQIVENNNNNNPKNANNLFDNYNQNRNFLISKNGINFTSQSTDKDSNVNITTNGADFEFDAISSETFASSSMLEKWKQEFNELKENIDDINEKNKGQNIVEVCKNQDSKCIMKEFSKAGTVEKKCNTNNGEGDDDNEGKSACHGSNILSLNDTIYNFDTSTEPASSTSSKNLKNSKLRALKVQVEELLMDDDLTYSEKANIAKKVKIYREGSYNDILGSSVNTKSLKAILDKNNTNDNIAKKMKALPSRNKKRKQGMPDVSIPDVYIPNVYIPKVNIPKAGGPASASSSCSSSGNDSCSDSSSSQ